MEEGKINTQLSSKNLEFVNRESTRKFVDAATKFLDLLEDRTLTIAVFIKLSHNALINLYSAGENLEEIELTSDEADINFDRNDIFKNENVGRINELGEQAFYWEVFNPTYSEQNGYPNAGWNITDREASQGWLVDDFGDIYRDLKIELEKIQKIGTDEAVEDAFWQLKFGFRTHWGEHAISAMRYLHYFWYENKL